MEHPFPLPQQLQRHRHAQRQTTRCGILRGLLEDEVVVVEGLPDALRHVGGEFLLALEALSPTPTGQ